MLRKLTAGLLLSITVPVAFAESADVIHARSDHSAYLQDSRGVIVRSGSGLCWRTGTWTPADAVIGCDGALVPPVARPTAPPIAPPVAVQAPPPAPAPVPAPRCDFSVTLDNDAAFGFDRASLAATARHELDRRVLERAAQCGRIDRVRVIGHADRLGSVSYNQRLSEQRAAAVATYLHGKRMSAPIESIGVGESEPVASCSPTLAGARLRACLAADRRVTIEVEGQGR